MDRVMGEKKKYLIAGVSVGLALVAVITCFGVRNLVRGKASDMSAEATTQVALVEKNEGTSKDRYKDEKKSESAEMPQSKQEVTDTNEETALVGEESLAENTSYVETIQQINQKKKDYAYFIRVNRAANCVTVYGRDSNDDYTVPLKAMVCSTGRDTPSGVFSTSDYYVWRKLVGGVYGQYAVRISGPILFHSVPYYSTNKNDLETEEYNKLGIAASLGCIRLSVADAKWIYDNCDRGTIVEIYDDAENPGPLGKPSSIKINAGCGWDPTDPDENNPWHHSVVSIEGISDRLVERGDISFDRKSGIIAYDGSGNDVTDRVQVFGDVDVYTTGTYDVTYSSSDETGTGISYTIKVTVVDTVAPAITVYPVNHVITAKTNVNDDFFREGMAVSDAGIAMSLSEVNVSYEPLHEGDNVIKYIIRDASGNVTEYTNNVFVDRIAPQIILKEDKNVSADIVIDEAYARSRVVDVIEANELDSSGIQIAIKQISETEYSITYSCLDFYGNVGSVTENIIVS